ncbi:MAG: hypothetical protein ACXIVQ_12080 [Acidimicrobiales bacterium]
MSGQTRHDPGERGGNAAGAVRTPGIGADTDDAMSAGAPLEWPARIGLEGRVPWELVDELATVARRWGTVELDNDLGHATVLIITPHPTPVDTPTGPDTPPAGGDSAPDDDPEPCDEPVDDGPGCGTDATHDTGGDGLERHELDPPGPETGSHGRGTEPDPTPAGNGTVPRPEASVDALVEDLARNGPATSDSGFATRALVDRLGWDPKVVSALCAEAERRGLIVRRIAGRRTYRIAAETTDRHDRLRAAAADAL